MGCHWYPKEKDLGERLYWLCLRWLQVGNCAWKELSIMGTCLLGESVRLEERWILKERENLCDIVESKQWNLMPLIRAALGVWVEIQKYSNSVWSLHLALSLSCLTWVPNLHNWKIQGAYLASFQFEGDCPGKYLMSGVRPLSCSPEILLLKSCSNGWGMGCFLWDRCWEWERNGTQQN